MGNSPSTDSGSTIDISNFKLRQIIGKGGFGVVRIVEKRDTKQKYALKYINKKKCIKKQSVRNIFRERIILERCDHPFIINLQFAFQDDEHMFMVLDLAIGGDLRFHLVRNGILPEKTIRIYAMEIAAAISYLHSNDILHRDIKPENLLIDERGHIHLTDFNVAIMLKEKIPTSRSGTTAYMAPEMFMQKPYTYSVDWWAMGIVLYECTFNKHPFQGSGSSIEKAIVRNPIIFPNQYEVTPGRFPYVESQDRTDFIKRLLVRTVHERLGCGSQGNLEIKNHQWFQKMDWNMVLRKQVVPDFIPDPSQNNYDFGAALEELLYESSPLASKPVKKRKDKKDPPPSLSMLWQDDSMVSRKQTEHNKLEQELDYIEQYFEPYIKPISPVAVVETPLASIQMPPTQREYTRSKKSTSRKSLDAGKMLLEEQQAFKTGPRAVAMKRGHSQHSKSQSISSFDIDESVPPIPNNLVYRDSFIQTKLKEPMGSNPMLTKMAPTRTMDSTNRTIDSKISGYSIDQVDPSPPKKYNQQIRQKSNDTGSSKQSPATSPFKIKTQLKPVDIFDTAFKELDLSFPDRPEMTPSPKSPTKKSRRS